MSLSRKSGNYGNGRKESTRERGVTGYGRLPAGMVAVDPSRKEAPGGVLRYDDPRRRSSAAPGEQFPAVTAAMQGPGAPRLARNVEIDRCGLRRRGRAIRIRKCPHERIEHRPEEVSIVKGWTSRGVANLL